MKRFDLDYESCGHRCKADMESSLYGEYVKVKDIEKVIYLMLSDMVDIPFDTINKFYVISSVLDILYKLRLNPPEEAYPIVKDEYRKSTTYRKLVDLLKEKGE